MMNGGRVACRGETGDFSGAVRGEKLACLREGTGEYLLGACAKYFKRVCISLCVCIDCVLLDVPVRGFSLFFSVA